MHIEPFDNIEEFFEKQRKAEKAAIANIKDFQKAITYGDYWMRYIPEYELMIFGYIIPPEELYSSPAYASKEAQADIPYEKKMEQSAYERGYRFGRAYSVAEPDGELGSTHISTMAPLTKEEFETAKSVNWNMDEFIKTEAYRNAINRIIP